MAHGKVEIVYIGGWGRSGSTLLALMLAQVPGIVSPGELRFVWDRGVLGNELCGCGTPFLDCPFWEAVGGEAYGAWSVSGANEMLQLEKDLQRLHSVPGLWSDRWWNRIGPRYSEYHERLSRLYEALRAVAGVDVVVDSTKDVPYAYVLSRAPDLEMKVLHLVRDSRAVAHSWTRAVRRPEVAAMESFMDRYHPARSALRWVASNALFSALGRSGVPYRRVRYETLVADPVGTLADSLEFAGVDRVNAMSPFDGSGRIRLGTTHTVSGNPMRFATGALALSLDDEWRRVMPRWTKGLVTALTLPSLRAYGYVGARRNASDAEPTVANRSRRRTT